MYSIETDKRALLRYIPIVYSCASHILVLHNHPSGDPALSGSDNRKINSDWGQEMVERVIHIKSATPFFSFIMLTFCLFGVFSSKSKSRIMPRFKYSSPKPEY